MRHVESNVDNQMIAKAIQEEVSWEDLPKRLKQLLVSEDGWQRRVKEYCIKNRLRWSDCHAKNMCKENDYYRELMSHLSKSLELFPYHLSDYVCRILRVSPFQHYSDVLFEVMKTDRSYDSIPNFSAADALRVTGIGRNEFIDIMNKCKTKKLMWKINKSIAKDLLPVEPLDSHFEPWWIIGVVNLTLEEFKKLSDEESAVFDKVCKSITRCKDLDLNTIKTLHRRNLLYYEVPVSPDDHFQVSTLHGFISNREQSYEDPFEELLYTVFVASSEYTTIAELAITLQVDLMKLEAVVSLMYRMRWAERLDSIEDLAEEKDDSECLLIVRNEESNEENCFVSSPKTSEDKGKVKLKYNFIRFAFLVDVNLTSYLMMGSLSPGLKEHAVTLFEAGKLGNSSVVNLCEDLHRFEGTILEGELQHFLVHALSLRHSLECLCSGGVTLGTVNISGRECEKDAKNNNTQLNYTTKESLHVGNIEEEDSTSNLLDLFIECEATLNERENSKTIEATTFSSETRHAESVFTSNDILLADMKISEDVLSSKMDAMIPKYKNTVDLLRCESLAGLTSLSLQRVIERDYDVVVSMIPLPTFPEVISPGSNWPAHFGPPSKSAITPWMKLLLYFATKSGPTSVVLIKGQRLRLLPQPLEACTKALVWTWSNTNIGGIGGDYNGTLVEGGILLHSLNEILKVSAVLVQPISEDTLEKGKPKTLDVPLPFKREHTSRWISTIEKDPFEYSSCIQGISDAANSLGLWTVGYMRFILVSSEGSCFGDKTFTWAPQSIGFGLPLFDADLCKSICQTLVDADMFSYESLNKHCDSMEELKKKLQDFIADYQANGSLSRMAYSNGLWTSGVQHQLASQTSRRWSTLNEKMFEGITPFTPESPLTSRYSSADENSKKWPDLFNFGGDARMLQSFSSFNDASISSPDTYKPPTTGQHHRKDLFSEDVASDVQIPSVNLLFHGGCMCTFDISTCLHGKLPASLIAEAEAEIFRHSKKMIILHTKDEVEVVWMHYH